MAGRKASPPEPSDSATLQLRGDSAPSSGREPRPAAAAACLHDGLAGPGRHSVAKPMPAGTLPCVGLERALHFALCLDFYGATPACSPDGGREATRRRAPAQTAVRRAKPGVTKDIDSLQRSGVKIQTASPMNATKTEATPVSRQDARRVVFARPVTTVGNGA